MGAVGAKEVEAPTFTAISSVFFSVSSTGVGGIDEVWCDEAGGWLGELEKALGFRSLVGFCNRGCLSCWYFESLSLRAFNAICLQK